MNKQNLATAIALCIGAVALAGCNREAGYTSDAVEPAEPGIAADPVASPDVAHPAAEGTVTVADIAGNPAAYAGKTVTVVADVEEVLGPEAFSLDEDSAVTGGVDNDLLVLGRKDANLAAIDDQWLNNKVRVTGVVGSANVVELEREIGWDLDPELEAEIGSEPVLVATSVERI